MQDEQEEGEFSDLEDVDLSTAIARSLEGEKAVDGESGALDRVSKPVQKVSYHDLTSCIGRTRTAVQLFAHTRSGFLKSCTHSPASA